MKVIPLTIQSLSDKQSDALLALPIYNEEHTLEGVYRDIREVYSGDILLLNDGSTDRTSEILLTVADNKTTVVDHQENQGYGQSIMSVFHYAIESGYESLVIMDGDGQHDPLQIDKFLERVQHVDVVSGSRYYTIDQGGDAAPEERRRINCEITRTINECLGFNITDAFCGYKAYRVEPLKNLQLDDTGYAFPLQFWVQAAANNLEVEEIPVPRVYLDLNRSFGRELDDAEVRFRYYMNVFDKEHRRVYGVSYCDALKKKAACCSCSCDDQG